MDGLTMDFQLTIDAIGRRVESLSGEQSVDSRRLDGELRRSTWGETMERARRFGAALTGLGVQPGDRVASLCWNQSEHLDAYFGVPLVGGVLHTLNPRMRAADLAKIIEIAGSRILLVDSSLAGLLEEILERTSVHHVIMAGGEPSGRMIDYDSLLAASDPFSFTPRENNERDACTLCFTTGTTGLPKGVLYSHRAVALQALTTMASDFGGVCAADKIMVVVPMFHGNSWNHPYAAALAGAALVLPHSDLSPESILGLIEAERVTTVGGVPAVWLGVLAELDENPDKYDLSSLRLVRIGGDRMTVPLLRGLMERHHVPVACGFGMTELGPFGGLGFAPSGIGSGTEDWNDRCKTGWTLPFLEVRAQDEEGPVPWDGKSVGELEYRGVSVASGYWSGDNEDAFTPDGWLRSGDMATIDSTGQIDMRDRSKDMIKSGGEWISSKLLEQALESHPDVVEVAIIGIPDDRWQERPLGVVVTVGESCLTAEDLHIHIGSQVPRWWLPERFEFIGELPRTAVGKVRKDELRDRFAVPIETTAEKL